MTPSDHMLKRRARFERQRQHMLIVLAIIGVGVTALLVAIPGPLALWQFGALTFVWSTIWFNLAIYQAIRQRNLLFDLASENNSVAALNALGRVSVAHHALFCALLLDPAHLYRAAAKRGR